MDCLSKNFQGLRVGFLDPRVWHYPAELIERIEEVDRQIVRRFCKKILNLNAYSDDLDKRG